ncbi:unnamed protein product [Adineta ricciae]|uniref:UNC93-like protein n=1 Tax=Adineta ricciae TaxID=249248 RepID=A0A815M3Y2_ADIRI|nr:unnamed protein product [Adineta ricciae]
MSVIRVNEFQGQISFIVDTNDDAVDVIAVENVESKPNENIRYSTYKNLLVISISFLLQYISYDSIKNLQSSINSDANVGVHSLSIIHGCFLFSSLFLSHPIISIFGLKWTLFIGQIPFLLIISANFHPEEYLMYPAAVFVGLSSPLLWTSAYSYITDLASKYAEKTNAKKEVIIGRFIGIFYMFDQSAQIWGNLLSFLILSPEDDSNTNETIWESNFSIYGKCGADFSEREYNDTLSIHSIERKTFNTLCIIYICICACSILLTLFFLDRRDVKSQEKLSVIIRKSTKLFISTIKQIGNRIQIFLIPITILIGLEQAFISAMFSKAFVSCTNNPKYVGLVFIVYGVCNSLGCFSFGHLIKFIGRCPIFLCAFLIDCILIIVMLIWKPAENTLIILCVIIAFWGITDGIWLTQITVLYGILFPDKNEIGFLNFCLWESVGYLAFYLLMPFIRIRIALIILLIDLVLSIVGYGIIKYRWITKQDENTENKP